jgi:hypothetical protein
MQDKRYEDAAQKARALVSLAAADSLKQVAQRSVPTQVSGAAQCSIIACCALHLAARSARDRHVIAQKVFI